uniref:Uncharacterized protein n=1 Tax=Anguilla anguilla TaxID=7936 RepID=A0A0E9TEY1_ANGAN
MASACDLLMAVTGRWLFIGRAIGPLKILLLCSLQPFNSIQSPDGSFFEPIVFSI